MIYVYIIYIIIYHTALSYIILLGKDVVEIQAARIVMSQTQKALFF